MTTRAAPAKRVMATNTAGGPKATIVTGDERFYRTMKNRLAKALPLKSVAIWTRDVSPLTSTSRKGVFVRRLADELRNTPALLRLVMERTPSDALICSTPPVGALLSWRLVRLFRPTCALILINFYFHASGEHPLVRLALRCLLSDGVAICVQNPAEVEYYRRLAPSALVRYVAYGGGDVGDPGQAAQPPTAGDYIFSGGYSSRDYGTLVEAASGFPDEEFVIACATANRLPERLPANVRVVRDAEPTEFARLLGHSKVVVLPLVNRPGSAGQMVALDAMRLARPLVFADVPAVAQYCDHRDSGMAFRPGDPDDLARKLREILADERLARTLAAHAQDRWARHFTGTAFEEHLADCILYIVRRNFAASLPMSARPSG